MDITQAIYNVQAHWRQVEGIRPDAAPDEPVDNLEPLPMVNSYELTIEENVSEMYSDTFAPTRGVIRSDLHLSRSDLAKTMQRGRAMCKAFRKRIQDDPNLGGNVMIVRLVRATFSTFEKGSIVTLGYRVELEYDSEEED